MVDKNFVHKLAVERCRFNISQLCALMHLHSDSIGDDGYWRDNLFGLFESLNKDLQIIEDILTDQTCEQ